MVLGSFALWHCKESDNLRSCHTIQAACAVKTQIWIHSFTRKMAADLKIQFWCPPNEMNYLSNWMTSYKYQNQSCLPIPNYRQCERIKPTASSPQIDSQIVLIFALLIADKFANYPKFYIYNRLQIEKINVHLTARVCNAQHGIV